MKRIFFTLMAALLFFSGCNKTKQFTVTLNLDNADKKTIYLCKDVDSKEVSIDTAVFAGNQAVFKVDFDDPQTCYIIKFDPVERCGAFPFFTENKNTIITGDKEAIEKWMVKGCAIMDDYNAFRQELLPMEESMKALFNEVEVAYFSGDTVRTAELYAQVDAAMADYDNFRFDYYKNQQDTYLTHFMVLQEADDLGYEKVKELAEGGSSPPTFSTTAMV